MRQCRADAEAGVRVFNGDALRHVDVINVSVCGDCVSCPEVLLPLMPLLLLLLVKLARRSSNFGRRVAPRSHPSSRGPCAIHSTCTSMLCPLRATTTLQYHDQLML